MKLSKLFLVVGLLASSSALLMTSCGEEEIIPVEIGISDDFDLIGKWNFTNVAGEGVIFGLPQSSEDENPMGFVEFFDDGTGFSNFSVELLNMPFELIDSVVWSRPSNDSLIVQAVTEGKVDRWHIIAATIDSVNAEWPINIAGNTATLNAQFRKD